MQWITSIRKPSTPRSSQKRSVSCIAATTSGFAQFRSGCSGRKRWRYHCPVASSQVQAGPFGKAARQLFGGRSGRAVAPDVPVALARAPGSARFAEPRVLVARVVGNPVDDHAQPARVGFGQQAVEIGERSEQRIDVAVVGDVVAVVLHRRAEEGRDPERVDAEPDQVVEAPADALEVAHAVAVRVEEAARDRSGRRRRSATRACGFSLRASAPRIAAARRARRLKCAAARGTIGAQRARRLPSPSRILAGRSSRARPSWPPRSPPVRPARAPSTPARSKHPAGCEMHASSASVTAACPCGCGERTPMAGSSARLGVALPSAAPGLAAAVRWRSHAPPAASRFSKARFVPRHRSRSPSGLERDPRSEISVRNRRIPSCVATLACWRRRQPSRSSSSFSLVPARACSVCQAGDPLFSAGGATAQEQGTLSGYLEVQGWRKTSGLLPEAAGEEPEPGREVNQGEQLSLYPGLDADRPSDRHARCCPGASTRSPRSPRASSRRPRG